MRKFLLFIIIISSVFSLNAQQSLVYQSYVLDSDSGDTSFVEVKRFGRQLKIQDINTFEGQLIPGMSENIVYADYKANRVYNQSRFDDGDVYYCSHSFENSNVTYTLEGEEYMNGYECRKYRTTINSNSIEIWMTDKLGFNATPIVNRGFLRGVLVRQVINGNRITELNSVIKDKRIKQERIPIDLGILVPAKEMTRITSDKLVIKKNIFDNEQIYFADIEKFEGEIPYDSVIHFAHGTLILKRVYLDTLPEHYSYFIEMKEQSNGDAYDRSGSVFVIPTDRELSLEDALLNDIELLHSYTDRRGIIYRKFR